MSLKSEIEKLFRRKPPEKKPAPKPVESESKSPRIDGGDAKWESRKKILHEKDNSEVAKAYAHFKGLSETGAGIINDQIEQDKARPPAIKDLGGYLIKSILDKTINTSHPTLSVEEGIKILVQGSAIYSENPSEAQKFTQAINELLNNLTPPVEANAVLQLAAQQLGEMQARNDYTDIQKYNRAVNFINDEVGEPRNMDIQHETEAGFQNRQDEQKKEIFGDPLEMPDKVRQKIQEIYTELDIVPNPQKKLRDQNWLEEKQQHVSQNIDHDDAENIEMAKEVNKKLEAIKLHVQEEHQQQEKITNEARRLPEEVKSEYDEIYKEMFTTGLESMGEITQRYGASEDNNNLPVSLQSLFDNLREAMWLDPSLRNDYDSEHSVAQFKKPKDVNTARLLQQISQAETAGLITDTEAGKLNSLVNTFKRRTELLGDHNYEAYDTLTEAGISDAEEKDYFGETTSDQNFFRQITSNTQNYINKLLVASAKDQQGMLEEMRKRIKSISESMLEIAYSDEATAFEVKFNPLIHEPKYNKMIASLSQIEARVKDHEARLMQQGKQNEIAKVDVLDRDRKERRYRSREIRLSDAIDLVNLQAKDEREIVRYTNNVYVIHLTHNHEAFKGYANSINNDTLNRQYINNPGLSMAKRLMVSAVQVEYGLNYYMCPEETMFAKNDLGDVPVLKEVQEKLIKNGYTAAEAKRLSLKAMGYMWGVEMEGHDINLYSGPRRSEAGRQSTGPTEHFGILGWNWAVTFRRFSQNLPFENLLAYVKYGGDGEKNIFKKIWNAPRIFVNEEKDAKRLKALREQRSHGRTFSVNELHRQGVAKIDATGIDLKVGGLLARGPRWRGDEAYKEYFVKDSEGHVKKAETLDKLIEVNPQYANHIVERWFQGNEIDLKTLKKYKSEVLHHLREIAPQFAVYMERDILYSVDGKGKPRLENYANLSTHELSKLVKGAEEVSEYLIRTPLRKNDGSFLRNKKISEIGDLQSWADILYPNKDQLTTQEVKWVENVKNFMEELAKSNGVVDDLIEKGLKLKRSDSVPGVKIEGHDKTLEAWNETVHTDTFPIHYQNYVDFDWEATGHRTVGRMVGDNFTLGDAHQQFFEKQKEAILAYLGNPQQFKDAKFVPLIAPIGIIREAYNKVHGDFSKEEANAAALQGCYGWVEQIITLLNRDTASRYIWGTSQAQQLLGLSKSSWIASKMESPNGEIEAGEVRTIIDSAVKQYLIAPYHGYMLNDALTVNKLLDTSISDLLGRSTNEQIIYFEKHKIFQDWPLPLSTKTDLKFFAKDKDGKRKFVQGGLKLIKPFRLNAARMRRETGGTNFHVTMDTLETLLPLLVGLILLSAFKQSTEDNK